MLQNPPPTVTDVGVPEAPQGLAVGPAGSGGLGPVAVVGWQARNSSPGTPLQRPTREKVRPARQKTPILGHYEHAGRTFSRSHPPPDHAGRTFSRTGRTEVVTVKPTTPLQPLIQASVKPPSPMQAKNAPKTPNFHPQRRCQFQLRLGRRPQRRWRFQSPTDTSEQRRSRFQTSGPPGRQGLAAAPVGGDDTTTTHISHVIYRGHFSRHPKNVAIPTTHIQCLNEP